VYTKYKSYSKQSKVIGRPRDCVNGRFVSYHLNVLKHCCPCTWHAGHCEVDGRSSYSAGTRVCENVVVLSARLGRRTMVLFRLAKLFPRRAPSAVSRSVSMQGVGVLKTLLGFPPYLVRGWG
jgi:hypothetical protein